MKITRYTYGIVIKHLTLLETIQLSAKARQGTDTNHCWMVFVGLSKLVL